MWYGSFQQLLYVTAKCLSRDPKGEDGDDDVDDDDDEDDDDGDVVVDDDDDDVDDVFVLVYFVSINSHVHAL